MKIACYEIKDWEAEYLKKKLKGHRITFTQECLCEKNLVKDANALCVFIYSKIDNKIINKVKKLKLITTRSTGYDHIDFKNAQKKGITVCNVPSYGENTVAEHAMALLLTISRRTYEGYDRVRDGNYSPEGLTGFDLKGKTIGVIGTGKIGQHLIRMAKGFEMKIIAYDAYPNKALAKTLGFEYVKKLDDLLKKSDVISLHVPYCPATHHLINQKNIMKLKKGCVLINTARGGCVETEAILVGLRKGRLKATGLDVLEEESFLTEELELLSDSFKKYKNADIKAVLQEHMLIEHPAVIVTPHNAFNSTEALTRILDTTIDNIKAFAKKKPVNTVK